MVRTAHAVVSLLVVVAGAPHAVRAAEMPADEARARVLQLADERRWDAGAIATLGGQGDPALRAAVAELASESTDPRAVRTLRTLAGDRVASVRAAAIEGAGRLCATLGATSDGCTALGDAAVRALADAEPEVRRAAAWAIGAGFPARGAALAERLAVEPSAAVRAAILAELWRAKGGDWAQAAIRALGAAEPAERYAAAWSLGRGAVRAALPALRSRAGDGDPLVRMAALEAGRRIDAPGFRPLFASALGDADMRVRIAALVGLESAGPGPGADGLAATVAAMIGDDAFPDVQQRVAAIRAAGALAIAGDALSAVAGSQEPWASGEALVALARQHATDAAVQVAAWRGSDDAVRREWAARAARYLADGGAAVAAGLADTAARVRLAAVESAEALPPERRVTALEPLLGDADAAVRASAVEALGKAGARLGTERLLVLLGKERGVALPDAAVALVDALSAGDALAPEARAALERLVSAPDPVVARSAWSALRRHGARATLPPIETGMDPAAYRAVVTWAAQPQWLDVRTWRGTMLIELDTAHAPLTAYRLARLAGDKYFDGLTFHRVVPDFVAQGGDPRGDGWGGPGFALRDELSLAAYDAGDVGMALAGPDTGGSQLFVTLTPQPHLVGRYPHVGRVVQGLDVAARLRVGDRILRVRAGSGELPPYWPVWYGPVDPARLDADIDGWRAEREKYAPDAGLVAMLASAKLRYELHVAMGTWCSDSHEQIPRLQKILAVLGDRSPFAAPTLIGVDRSKAVRRSEWPYGPVELVPTIVVTAGGAEVGRIVETPASGSIERDLVRILAPIEGWEVPEPAPTPDGS